MTKGCKSWCVGAHSGMDNIITYAEKEVSHSEFKYYGWVGDINNSVTLRYAIYLFVENKQNTTSYQSYLQRQVSGHKFESYGKTWSERYPAILLVDNVERGKQVSITSVALPCTLSLVY